MTIMSAVIIAAGVYLIVPDILTPIETVLFLWAAFVISIMVICWVQEQVQKIRAKRASLEIRKNRRRDKVIDFPMRGRVKHIPAFKVKS